MNELPFRELAGISHPEATTVLAYNDNRGKTPHKNRSECPCYTPPRNNLSGDNIRACTINLTGDELYVAEGFFLIYKKGMLRIYKYDASFHCERYKVISTNLLLFFVRRNALRKSVRFFFYNVLLNLTRSGTRRCEQRMESIMLDMKIDLLDDVRCGEHEVVCIYRNGDRRVFNFMLDEYKCSAREPETTRDRLPQNIEVHRNSVTVSHFRSAFKSVFRVPDIKQYLAFNEHLFLLTGSNIQVLSFED
jgi:hypothetical protein